MENVVINKPATASSYVVPYSPSRVNNSPQITPITNGVKAAQRWVCNTVPCYLMVDLQKEYYINNWVVTNMASLWGSPDYALQSYEFQVSMDGQNWRSVDSVVNNMSDTTSRNIIATSARFVRIYVTQGLRANPSVASIMELQVLGLAATSAWLQNMFLSTGDLQPSFISNTLSYTSQVNSDVSSITITPTAQDPKATIKVNGTVVASGKASASINLPERSTTPISIEVTPQIGDTITYSVQVTRCSNAQLSSIKLFPVSVKFNEVFSSDVYKYTMITSVASFKLTPTAKDSNAKITVADVSVPSGSQTTINLNSGLNIINIVVTPAVGTLPTTYRIEVTRR